MIAVDAVARVAELRCYPVKSCAGISLPAAELTPAGVSSAAGRDMPAQPFTG